MHLQFLLFLHVQNKLKTPLLLLNVLLKKQHVLLKKQHVLLVKLFVQLKKQPPKLLVQLAKQAVQLQKLLPSKPSLFRIGKCIRKAV